MSKKSVWFQAAQKDQPTRPQAKREPEAYPLGYVEDSCEPRTKLGAFFSSLLGLDGDVHKRRHTIRPLLIRHPQLKAIGAFL
jgi:hypothetical protein